MVPSFAVVYFRNISQSYLLVPLRGQRNVVLLYPVSFAVFISYSALN